MGNKNAQKREKKKSPKPKSKPALPGRSREDVNLAPARIAGTTGEKPD
jgi:hypothetical protein